MKTENFDVRVGVHVEVDLEVRREGVSLGDLPGVLRDIENASTLDELREAGGDFSVVPHIRERGEPEIHGSDGRCLGMSDVLVALAAALREEGQS